MEITAETRRRLELYMRIFQQYVEANSDGIPFTSFSDNKYLYDNEEYKTRDLLNARERLRHFKWKEADIGKGIIAKHAEEAVSSCGNLVNYNQKVHFRDILESRRFESESLLYRLYRKDEGEELFGQITGLFGRKYDLISYLYFLKDESRYLPIRPTFFDKSFALLGIDYKTSGCCSWKNYLGYMDIISSIRDALESYFGIPTRLIDAHSFVWTLNFVDKFIEASTFEFPDKFPDADQPKSREGIVQQRIGQGKYRSDLVDYWGRQCAVSNCRETGILVASHIKPWRDCNKDNEWIDKFNGLLLSPNIDALFDKGFITFDDNGQMVLSKHLKPSDANSLGASADLKLRKIEDGHRKYLAYHREHIFQSE